MGKTSVTVSASSPHQFAWTSYGVHSWPSFSRKFSCYISLISICFLRFQLWFYHFLLLPILQLQTHNSNNVTYNVKHKSINQSITFIWPYCSYKPTLIPTYNFLVLLLWHFVRLSAICRTAKYARGGDQKFGTGAPFYLSPYSRNGTALKGRSPPQEPPTAKWAQARLRRGPNFSFGGASDPKAQCCGGYVTTAYNCRDTESRRRFTVSRFGHA